MSVICVVFAIMGVCLCWLPSWGFIGMGFSAMAVAIGLLAITHWHRYSGSTGFGIAGIALGETGLSLGLAYQIKHAENGLDFIYWPLTIKPALACLLVATAVGTGGLLLARLKHRQIGVILAALAFTCFFVAAGWTLTTADRLEMAFKP